MCVGVPQATDMGHDLDPGDGLWRNRVFRAHALHGGDALMGRAAARELLDGQILRFVLTGLTEQSSRLPDSERDAWMLTNCGLFLEHYL